MRLAARTDDNHKEIIDQFRAYGCTVADTSRLGSGFPDCVVGLNGINIMVEIKDGKKSASRRKLTNDEEKFHTEWKGKIEVVKDSNDVDFVMARYFNHE